MNRSLRHCTCRSALAFSLLALCCLLGCAPYGGVKYHDPYMDFASIEKVAILPFTTLIQDKDGGERVRDVLATQLMASGSFYVIPTGEVLRGVARANIVNPLLPTSEEVVRFCEVTEVDGVFTGILREYGEMRGNNNTVNIISMSLQMMDCESGLVVWTASTTHGGISLSDRLFGASAEPLNDVTVAAIDDLLDKLFAQ